MPYRESYKPEPEQFDPSKHVRDGVGAEGSFVRKSAIENDEKAKERAKKTKKYLSTLQRLFGKEDYMDFLQHQAKGMDVDMTDAVAIEKKFRELPKLESPESGLFPNTDDLPLHPYEIEHFEPGKINGNGVAHYGKTEKEVAVNFLVHICKDLGKWSGISFERLNYELRKKNLEAVLHTLRTQDKYGVRGKLYDAGMVGMGIDELVAEGMLEIKDEGKDAVVFIKPRMFEPIIKEIERRNKKREE